MKPFPMVIIVLLSFLPSAWSVTLEEAVNLVTSQVCLNQMEGIRLSIASGFMSRGEVIPSYTDVNYPDEIVTPFNSYLFIVDRRPYSPGHHPCQWVFVNLESGETKILTAYLPSNDVDIIILAEPQPPDKSDQLYYQFLNEKIEMYQDTHWDSIFNMQDPDLTRSAESN